MSRVVLAGPTEARAGAELAVSVVLVDPAGAGAFDLDIAFDPRSMRAVRAGLGPLLGSTGRTAGALGPILDNAAGRVALGGYSHGPAPGPTASGELARVVFQALREGSAVLRIERLVLATTDGARMAAEASGLAIAVGRAGSGSKGRRIYLPTTQR